MTQIVTVKYNFVGFEKFISGLKGDVIAGKISVAGALEKSRKNAIRFLKTTTRKE